MQYTKPIKYEGDIWYWDRWVTLDWLGGTLFSVYEYEGQFLAFDAIAGYLWYIRFVDIDGEKKAMIWKAGVQDWSYAITNHIGLRK